ncbi:MAG: class I SAM-dependent rRNA methyltransferase [Desulfovibrio sp.]|nr:class I SAM-dependent rRNA methyltransferase [Desulfovibrio sp.]
MRALWLKKNEERRILDGHLWIFSNEVDTVKSPLTDFAPGEAATVHEARGRVLGSACVNPATLIAARLHSREADVELDAPLLKKRLAAALALRENLFDGPWYRLCHGEGDLLPGLVIDRYASHLTVQISTAAMQSRRNALLEALDALLGPASVYLANDLPARALEGLALTPESLGPVPETFEVPENGCVFNAPCASGQKTGWFYDQRANRAAAARLAKGQDVLDAFCYLGGFGVCAGANGAGSVTFLDASEHALSFARANLECNAPRAAACPASGTICADAFHALTELYESGRRFGLVSIDPPAFIKRRKDAGQGLAAYRKLNLLAARLVAPGGVLVSSSCSYHLPAEALRDCVARAAAKLGRPAQMLHAGGQGPDHPILLSMPETAYLKCCIARLG